MDNATIIAVLQSLINELGGAKPVTPPGTVAVAPTGPKGAGKVRFYPVPHPEQGETLLGYATRCMNTIVDGKPLYPAGRYAPIMQSAPEGANMAEQLDKIAYKTEWLTQEQLDWYAAAAERDRAQGESFNR
jgi:hypothetical protein